MFPLRLPKCPNISQVPLFDFFTGVFTLFELVVQEARTQVAGVVMVLDCKGFGLSHVRWAHFFTKDLNIVNISRFAFLQEFQHGHGDVHQQLPLWRFPTLVPEDPYSEQSNVRPFSLLL